MAKQTHKRLTVDLSLEAHRELKGVCAAQGISMREFVLLAIGRQVEELEDQMDLATAKELSRRIKSGEEEVISWEEMKKRLGWDAL